MNKLVDYLFNNQRFLCAAIWSYVGHLFSDETYLKGRYRILMGKRLNLNNPTLFSEKLQWLKLYNHRPEYTTIVDKMTVKDYVAGIIGSEYIIPTIGAWERPEDIEWDKLPQKFVLKTTHGGGSLGVVVCTDKSTFDKSSAIKKLKTSMKTDSYRIQMEWPYKNVHKRIIAEEYLEPDPETNDLSDYKFSCFNGKVTDVMVCYGRTSGNTKFYFFDKDWKLLPLNILGKNAPSDFTLPKPHCIDKMFELASKLSTGIPYARVDLYAVGNHPYFGEITFFPQSGFDRNLLHETEEWHGSLIKLPAKTI
ncbi:MAG: glycosyl transferase [Alphaproteobacteria bacterium]|nr:glycosyl transferase [Alphaproteobacteria bacterium]